MTATPDCPEEGARQDALMIHADVRVVDMVLGRGGWNVVPTHLDERRFSCWLLRGASEMCQVEVELGIEMRHDLHRDWTRIVLVTDPGTRWSRVLHAEIRAGGLFLGIQLTRMLTEAGCWWPRPGVIRHNRRDAKSQLLRLAATRLGLEPAEVLATHQTGEVLPEPLPGLVAWALEGGLEVRPCAHIAASELVERAGAEPSPIGLLLRLAEGMVGADWVALARSCHWTVGAHELLDNDKQDEQDLGSG